jgi:DNA-directed RNA polymerase subunit RPC12/RpoP
MIEFRCPVCKLTLGAADDQEGTKVTCPRCGQRLLIPNSTRNKTVLAESLSGPQAVPVGNHPAGWSQVAVPPQNVGMSRRQKKVFWIFVASVPLVCIPGVGIVVVGVWGVVILGMLVARLFR